jgi:hypothetical protein
MLKGAYKTVYQRKTSRGSTPARPLEPLIQQATDVDIQPFDSVCRQALRQLLCKLADEFDDLHLAELPGGGLAWIGLERPPFSSSVIRTGGNTVGRPACRERRMAGWRAAEGMLRGYGDEAAVWSSEPNRVVLRGISRIDFIIRI